MSDEPVRTTGNGKWMEFFRTVLASQVGGWVIALLAFAFISRWVIKDRAVVYQEMQALRSNALPLIIDTKAVTLENKRILEEIKSLAVENNRILQESHSENLPKENQRSLQDVNRKLDKLLDQKPATYFELDKLKPYQ